MILGCGAPCRKSSLTPTVKFHLASASGLNLFTGYGAGYVAVNGTRYESNLVVLPERIIDPWDAMGFEGLATPHFQFLSGLGVEVVLLGTGARLRFPSPALQRIVLESGTGLETMDAMAACRTYNILATEGRKVAAAILLA
jgi:uncharacterized protein